MERRWHDPERQEREGEQEGGYHRYDRFVQREHDIPIHGRYRYGPEEDRGLRPGRDWGGEDRTERWHRQRSGDYDRGEGDWRYGLESTGGRQRGERDQREQPEWGNTNHGVRRDSGLGFRRALGGDGRFWDSPEADRKDE